MEVWVWVEVQQLLIMDIEVNLYNILGNNPVLINNRCPPGCRKVCCARNQNNPIVQNTYQPNINQPYKQQQQNYIPQQRQQQQQQRQQQQQQQYQNYRPQ